MKGNSLRPRLVLQDKSGCNLHLLAQARRGLYLTRKTLKLPCIGPRRNSSRDGDYQTNNSDDCELQNSNLFFDSRSV